MIAGKLFTVHLLLTTSQPMPVLLKTTMINALYQQPGRGCILSTRYSAQDFRAQESCQEVKDKMELGK